MFTALNQTFKGKKTYATAIVAVLTAAITYFNGSATLMSALELAFTGVLGMTLRSAVADTLVNAITSNVK